MSYANKIHLKRLKRKRTLERRVKSWGNVFNASKQKKPTIFPSFLPKFNLVPERKKREGIISKVKSIFKPSV